MNTEALEWWFDDRNIEYAPVSDGYRLDTDRLSPDTLGEIRACGAAVSISTTGEFMILDSRDRDD